MFGAVVAGRSDENARLVARTVIGFALIARVCLCLKAPVETTDLVRNAAYGDAFFHYGFRLYDMFPPQLHSRYHHIDWPAHVYDYPFYSLFFYALLTLLSHELAVFKLVLTAIDLVSAWLIGRLTRTPWLAAAYFAGPLFMWWTSVEGQTESFMALLCLLALDALRRERSASAFALWGAAIQTKGLPLLLAPVFAAGKPDRVRNAAALLASFIPSLLAVMYGSYVARMFFEDGYKPSWPHQFRWRPFWDARRTIDALYVSEAAYSYVLFALASLGLLRVAYLVLVRRSRWTRLLQYVPLWCLLAWFKQAAWTQHWYFILVPAFATLIRDRRLRLAIILVSLLEPRACLRLWQLAT
jgi:hypothetical protein